MEFVLRMEPPTVTAQMHKVGVRRGKPFFYDPPEVKDAKAKLMAYLAEHRPEEPLTGPLALVTSWIWTNKDRNRGKIRWRDTKPDTDNLQKLLKDCMTQLGFWKDDAQVVYEACSKCWADGYAGIYIRLEPASDFTERLREEAYSE